MPRAGSSSAQCCPHLAHARAARSRLGLALTLPGASFLPAEVGEGVGLRGSRRVQSACLWRVLASVERDLAPEGRALKQREIGGSRPFLMPELFWVW